jgi:hypothetical protein
MLDVIYQHYPRGIEHEDPRYAQTEEHARLVAARRQAAGDERWRALLRRVSDRYPGQVRNHSLHLPTGNLDACFSFTLSLPGTARHRALWFRVSFLGPWHIIYASDLVEDAEETAALRAAPVDQIDVSVHGLHFLAPASVLDPDALRLVEEERRNAPPIMRHEIMFSPLPEEAPHVEAIGRDIAATFGTTFLPPEVGTTPVPDVATNLRLPGEATLYDLLFTESDTWVRAAPSTRFPCMTVAASQLPSAFVSVATVLAAFHVIVAARRGLDLTGVYCVVTTDGSLHREEMLETLASTDAAPTDATPAARELEALLRAWNGQGGPTPAMVAWASARLASS